jgi:hypothetical protein
VQIVFQSGDPDGAIFASFGNWGGRVLEISIPMGNDGFQQDSTAIMEVLLGSVSKLCTSMSRQKKKKLTVDVCETGMKEARLTTGPALLLSHFPARHNPHGRETMRT